jgi:hypothetical protein
MSLEITESIHGSSTPAYAAGSRNPRKEIETMMPMHDQDGLRRLERELRGAAEHARKVREARDGRDGPGPEPEAMAATVTVLPELVAEEPCVTCDQEQRERTSA